MLSEDQVFLLIQNLNTENKEKLIINFMPLAGALAKKFKYVEDARELAMLTLVECITEKIERLPDKSNISAYINASIVHRLRYTYYSWKNKVIKTKRCKYNFSVVHLTSKNEPYKNGQYNSVDFLDTVASVCADKVEAIIIKRFLQNYTDKEIGNELNVTQQTIQRKRSQILEKIGKKYNEN